jgi:UDP-glucose 4-epimerase
MSKYFITGGAGFIGSHLVEACLEKGAMVVVLDDLSTGKRENLDLRHPNLTFIEGNVTDQGLLNQIKTDHPDIAYVFHLGAIASVTQSMERPVHTHRVNFEGTLFLLESFKDQGLKKFMFASSAAVYGDTQEVPVNETMLPDPLSPYGADKLQSEYYMKIYNSAFDVPTIACRFFNVFGERQDPSSPYSGVISIFFERLMDKRAGRDVYISIFGDGKQTRDFIYVKDVVRGLLDLSKNELLRGEVFNLGYGKSVTIRELAERTRRLLNVDIDIRFEEEREGDIRHSQADIRKLRGTGFRFAYDFDAGLKALAMYLMNADAP